MRLLAYFLVGSIAAGCVLEERPVVGDGGADGGPFCVDCRGATPVCNDTNGECVQCTPEEAGECGADTPLCDPGLSQCVACVDDGDCTDPIAAKCDDTLQECVPCDDRAQCDDVEGFPGTANACNATGQCVDCTPASETDTCTGNVSCNPATETCTTTLVGSRGVCETCLADSECGDNGTPSDSFRCVPMFYQGTASPDDQTGFCLKRTEGGCEQPFSIPLLDRPSFSQPTIERDYCGINEALATCPAVNALLENQECPSGLAEECPQPSGLCERVGAIDDRCTYPCGLPVQCPADPPANTCDSSGSEPYCGN